jgi:hypothetical protein
LLGFVRFGDLRKGAASPVFERAQAKVPRDAEEPRGHGAATGELVLALDGAQEGILGDLLGLCAIAQHPVGERVDLLAAGVVEPQELVSKGSYTSVIPPI